MLQTTEIPVNWQCKWYLVIFMDFDNHFGMQMLHLKEASSHAYAKNTLITYNRNYIPSEIIHSSFIYYTIINVHSKFLFGIKMYVPLWTEQTRVQCDNEKVLMYPWVHQYIMCTKNLLFVISIRIQTAIANIKSQSAFCMIFMNGIWDITPCFHFLYDWLLPVYWKYL